ncbi:chaplin [Streptomyces sp. NPDC102384]|uniref:chaplin n=1 Tax=Streptomyces sp. NPDC102384 TaxID=3366166 RepID=UPI00381AA579
MPTRGAIDTPGTHVERLLSPPEAHVVAHVLRCAPAGEWAASTAVESCGKQRTCHVSYAEECHVPVTACGNTVSVIRLLNSAFGNTCATGADSRGHGGWGITVFTVRGATSTTAPQQDVGVEVGPRRRFRAAVRRWRAGRDCRPAPGRRRLRCPRRSRSNMSRADTG